MSVLQLVRRLAEDSPAAGITWTVSGPVLLALIALVGTSLAAWREAHGAKVVAQAPNDTSADLQALRAEMRSGFNALGQQVAELDRRLFEHVERHDEPPARRWRV